MGEDETLVGAVGVNASFLPITVVSLTYTFVRHSMEPRQLKRCFGLFFSFPSFSLSSLDQPGCLLLLHTNPSHRVVSCTYCVSLGGYKGISNLARHNPLQALWLFKPCTSNLIGITRRDKEKRKTTCTVHMDCVNTAHTSAKRHNQLSIHTQSADHLNHRQMRQREVSDLEDLPC